MTKDIVSRLRKVDADKETIVGDKTVLTDAANEIERLQSECATLLSDKHKLVRSVHDYKKVVTEFEIEIQSLRGEK